MSKELSKTYDPKDIEDRLYKKWEDNGYFHAGMVTNQGVELMLYSTLVETKDFAFDLNVTSLALT